VVNDETHDSAADDEKATEGGKRRNKSSKKNVMTNGNHVVGRQNEEPNLQPLPHYFKPKASGLLA
jgi:hypothetical protein